MLRIFTDFNARTADGVCWNLKYQNDDLEKQLEELGLVEGDKIIIYQDADDFDVTAELDKRYVAALGRAALVAVPDWSTLVRKGKWGQSGFYRDRYAEAIDGLRRVLANNPEDMAAVEGMAKALRASGEYAEALSFFERLATHRREDKTANVLAPGSAAWQIDIACLRWLLDDHSEAIHLMHGVAGGILDGSIKYGDAAGGMSQGLLLYYMAVTDKISSEISFALDYFRSRVGRAFSQVWPCPIAQYLLGDMAFETVMDAVNRQTSLSGLLDAAKLELGRRRRLTLALFHDGVRSRAQGDERHCLARMRECCGLENPLIEQEWYLARYEVRKTVGE